MKKEKEVVTAKIFHVTGRIEGNLSKICILFESDTGYIAGAAYNINDEHDQILLKHLQDLCHVSTIKKCIGSRVSLIFDERQIVAVGNAFKDKFYLLKGEIRAFKAEEIMSHEEGTIIDFSKKTASLGAGKQAVAI